MARNKFDVDEELETSFSFQHLKRLLSYMKPYRKEIVVTVSLMFLANIASLMGPYLIKIAMDDKIPNKDVKGLSILAIIFLFTLVVTGVCMKLRIRSMSRIGQNVLKQMRLDLFANLQRLPFSYYDNRPHGKILVRVVNYINSLSDLLSNGLINLITDSLSLFMAIGFMIAIDVKLTLISILLIPVLLAWVLILKERPIKY
jgi:ATP-binding cassette subfamily B protein